MQVERTRRKLRERQMGQQHVGTYPRDEDNPPKGGLILDGSRKSKGTEQSVLLEEWPAAYQLVGEVMAHQGYDG